MYAYKIGLERDFKWLRSQILSARHSLGVSGHRKAYCMTFHPSVDPEWITYDGCLDRSLIMHLFISIYFLLLIFGI